MPIVPETYMTPLQTRAAENGPIDFGPSTVWMVLMVLDIIYQISYNLIIACICFIERQLQMTQITIINLLDKIRSICKQCNFQTMPEKITSQQNITHLQSYLKTLEKIRLEFINYRHLQDDYVKLENLLQRQETETRKRIGVENQLKLFTDTLKSQIDELQREKIDLLQNTKTYIKQLKKTNQQLFTQLTVQNRSKGKSDQKNKQSSPEKEQKSRILRNNRSNNKAKQNLSIRQIIKTQYIDRQRSNSANLRKLKKGNQFGINSTVSALQNDDNQLKLNSKTYLIPQSSSGKKEKLRSNHNSRKKNNHLFSNITLFNYLDSSKKKLNKEGKSIFLAKSPNKLDKKKDIIKSRVQKGHSKHLWKDKRINKSVYSVLSLNQSNNMDTL